MGAVKGVFWRRKHLGWVLGGCVGAGRGQPRRELLWAFPSATMFRSVASVPHVNGKWSGPGKAEAHNQWGWGAVGAPEELGLEHFPEALYFPSKLCFIPGTVTSFS